MGDYRDKARIQTFNSGSLIPHDTYLNEQQDQIAAALETNWIDVPILNGVDLTGAGVYLPVASPIPGIRGTKVAGGNEEYEVSVPGHQWNRAAVQVLAARAKLEGNATSGAVYVTSYDAKYTAATTAPATSTTQTIFSGTFPGAGVYSAPSLTFGTPITLTEDLKLVVKIRNAGIAGQTTTVYGVQLKLQAPKA
jgi:hypothetical protein